MAAHSLSKTSTDAPKAQEERYGECATQAPASNQEALELLGMESVSTVQDFGADPKSLSEEILAMEPSMVGVILDALPIVAIGGLSGAVLAYAPVREWLMEQAGSVVSSIAGASEVVLEELVPVGCGLEIGMEFDSLVGEVVAGGSAGMTMTRTGQDTWMYVLSTGITAGLGAEAGEKQELGGWPVAYEGEVGAAASLTKTLGLEAVFKEARSPQDIVQLVLGSGELASSLGKLAALGVLKNLPDEVAISSTLTASASASITGTLLTQVAPGLGRQVDAVGAEMGWELAAGQECRVSKEEGMVQSYELSSKSTFGAVLEGYLPWLHELGQVAEQEGVTLTVRLKIISTEPQLLDITYVEDLDSGCVTRVYTSVLEFLAGDSRLELLDERLEGLAAGDLSMMVEQPLPREEAVDYGVEGPDSKSEYAQTKSSLKVQQTVRFAGAPDLPSSARSQFFQGGDTALLQALVQIAREGSCSDLHHVDQALAWSMLTVEPPRVVGSVENSIGFSGSSQGKKGEAKATSFKAKEGVTRHIDLPYTGQSFPMK